MRFLDAEAIHAALDYRDLVEALRAGHRRGIEAVERLLIEQGSGRGPADHLLLWSAWQRGEAVGVKLVTIFPGNAESADRTPTIQALYVLFDGCNGAPLAVLDGTALTLRKTAADSALGAAYLAPATPTTLLMVGAGNQAPHLVMAHHAVRPSIRRVLIWNRTPARARRLADRMRLDGVEFATADDLAEAVAAADVVSCATMATEPLIKGEWLQPGTHLDLVGGYTNDMREADDEVARRATIFVDSRRFTMGQCGDITGPLAAGVITKKDIVADLFDLCRGVHPGRRDAREITFFKNAGGGHLDLMAARLAYERAATHLPSQPNDA
ncbi:MAG TPA: ornithine cyclodeaminase family protein [Alphaproteobacteria bacterium]|nr:ornithine cyclodeaminase family protein [Alphaproteobacteria bacterium]